MIFVLYFCNLNREYLEHDHFSDKLVLGVCVGSVNESLFYALPDSIGKLGKEALVPISSTPNSTM